MQQVHPTTNSSAACSALSADRRLELLYEQLLEQNRRAATPFSHPLSRLGALHKLCEHIQDLSRLADAAILNAESAPTNISALDADLRSLLKTQASWTDRLENQIWRLESQAKWHEQLRALTMEAGPSENAVNDFCSRLAGETSSLPTGLLLLPEPGLSFAPARRIDGWSRRLAWAIEAVRLAVFASSGLNPHENSAWSTPRQLIACMLMVASDSGAAEESSFHGNPPCSITTSLAETFAEYLTVPNSTERSRLIRFCAQIMSLMKTIESASLSAVDRLIPPELVEHYSRACRTQLFRPFTSSEPATADRVREKSDLSALIGRMGLSPELPGSSSDSQIEQSPTAESASDSDLSRNIESLRFRIHSADEGWQPSRSFGRRSESSGEYRPKLFVADESSDGDFEATETAESAELIRDY